MFALFANPTRIHDNLYAGRIVSRHRTLTGMARALDRAQAPTRRANPGSHLNLQPMTLAADGTHGAPLRGEDQERWFEAQALATNY